MKTNVIAASDNVQGNIGNCSVNSQDVNVNSFYIRTVAVNSCNGNVISDNTYFDMTWIVIPGIIISVFGIAVLMSWLLNR